MEIFLKKLGSQESGYSGDIPDQRGKYILMAQKCWPYFPDLSASVRNSFCTLRVKIPNGNWVGIIYVWNNTFNFPEIGGRDHNERRLYRNRFIEEGLDLDRNVILGLTRKYDNSNDYYANSCHPNTSEYEALDHFLETKKNTYIFDLSLIKTIAPNFVAAIEAEQTTTTTISSTNVEDEEVSIVNSDEILDDAKRYLTHLGDIVSIDGDPLNALKANFRTQSDFSTAVRGIYKGKCALRESYIYRDHPIGLEAAHIHSRYNGGNFLPSNGILLSVDLHRAFDEGIWTLSDDLRVIVHEKIQDGLLMPFSNKELSIPSDSYAFKPYLGYVKWHRENRFGLFTRETLVKNNSNK